jgi:hypothetical protein
MRKGIVLSIFFVAFVLLCACAVPVQAWQGRISGMGEVTGLVEDESDFLTHPASIAGGKGLNFYGDMRFKNLDVEKFSFSTKSSNAANPSIWSVAGSDAAGREWQYSGLTGTAFPVGPGRMGIFFQYTGLDGSMNGDMTRDLSSGAHDAYSFDLKNKLDDLSLRFLFGVPMGGNMKLGGELQIGQKKEKKSNFIGNLNGVDAYANALYGYNDGPYSLLQYGVPFDSKYYEASLKTSAEAKIGPVKASFTARGGIPFSSENNYYYAGQGPGTIFGGDHDGKVKGYNVGADAWVRFPLNSLFSLPFLLQFDYKRIERHTEGREMGGWSPWYGMHENKEKSMVITAGGGMDYTPAQGTRVAGGLYYTYLNNKTDFLYGYTAYPPTSGNWFLYNHGGYPKTTEHKLSFKASAEKVFSSDFTFNGGFNAFYGWMKQDYNYDFLNMASNSTQVFGTSLKGKHWGTSVSLGASIKAGDTTLEPFLAGGFERLNLSGDGTTSVNGVLTTLITDTKAKKNVWSIGGGLALRF